MSIRMIVILGSLAVLACGCRGGIEIGARDGSSVVPAVPTEEGGGEGEGGGGGEAVVEAGGGEDGGSVGGADVGGAADAGAVQPQSVTIKGKLFIPGSQ